MNKPASLRSTLELALPYLASDPDRLVMFIEGGKIASGMGGTSFEYKYTLSIGLIDFTQHPDTVMIPLLQWIRKNEPSLLQNPERATEAITFDAEILSHSSYDLQLKLKLSERVKVASDGVTITATHLPEPDLGEMLPLAERIEVYVKDELVYDSANV